MENLLRFFSFADPNVRFVTIGAMLLAATAAVAGCFALLRKRALLGEAISHSVLPGVCLAFILSGAKHPLVLLAGASATGWLSVLVTDWITRHSKIKADAAIGLTLSVFFGAGVLLLSIIQRSNNAAQSGLDKFLFGKAASMIWDDVLTFGAVALLLLVVVLVFYKSLFVVSFDAVFARVIGWPVYWLEVLFTTLTVLAVVVGVQAVGAVLMSAMLITPALAARCWTNRLPAMLGLAAVFGALSGLFGALASFLAPAMPTGPWMTVSATVIAAFSLLFGKEKGVWRQLKKN